MPRRPTLPRRSPRLGSAREPNGALDAGCRRRGRAAALLAAALAASGLATGVAGCRRSLNNPVDPSAPSFGGDTVLVDPGPARAASVGDTLLFAGRFTGDTSRVAEYAWDFDGDGNLDWRSRENAAVAHAFRAVGEFRPRFVVRGVAGDVGEGAAVVRITDEAPRGGIGPDTLAAPGDTVVLVPAVEDDGRIVRWEWDLDGDGRFETTAGGPDPIAAPMPAEGERVMALRVTDDDGRVASFARRIGVCPLPALSGDVAPSDGASDLPVRQVLRWQVSGACGEPYTYDLSLDTANPPARIVLLAAEVPAFHTGLLAHGRTYWWRVVVRDSAGRRLTGPVFSFRTRSAPAGMAFIRPGYTPIGSSRNPDESPAHSAYVEGFYIDRRETTRGEFLAFLDATGYAPEGVFERDAEPGTSDLPATGVTWADAAAYAAWRGKRLPTEAEWEYAARGPRPATFPWGNGVPVPVCDFANVVPWPDPPCRGELAPVGSFPEGRSWALLDDAAGNAGEWVADWYDPEYYADPAAGVLPAGPASGTLRVVRGGSFRTPILECTATRRYPVPPDSSSDEIGFRCAVSFDAPLPSLAGAGPDW